MPNNADALLADLTKRLERLVAQAKKEGERVRVYRYSYDHLDRAVCEGEAWGLAKVVCNPNGRILGASILGPHSGEAISNLVIAMENGITLDKLTKSIFVYPTMNRIVRRLGDERFLSEGVSPFVRRFFGRFKGRDGDA